jgi:tRNA-dihydrouridine synthase
LAREIIRAAILGASGLPVSVKTRIGFNKEEIDTWIPEILKEDISALTVHARTKKEMSTVPANWDYIKRVVKLVKKSKKNIPVIGNGDIKSLEEGRKRILETGCAGVMIGRGVFGNPWFFAGRNFKDISIKEKIKALKEHIHIFERKLLKTKNKNYSVMKKHFKAYINGFPACDGQDGAKELRAKLMQTEIPADSLKILTTFEKTLK